MGWKKPTNVLLEERLEKLCVVSSSQEESLLGMQRRAVRKERLSVKHQAEIQKLYAIVDSSPSVAHMQALLKSTIEQKLSTAAFSSPDMLALVFSFVQDMQCQSPTHTHDQHQS